MKLPLDLEQNRPYLKVLDFISDLFYSYNNQSIHIITKVKTNAKTPIQNHLFPAVNLICKEKIKLCKAIKDYVFAIYKH